jgi:hypothetical protein
MRVAKLIPHAQHQLQHIQHTVGCEISAHCICRQVESVYTAHCYTRQYTPVGIKGNQQFADITCSSH